MQMSLKQVEELNSRLQRANNMVKRTREEGEKIVERFLTLAETNGTTFIAGVVNGRFGNPEVLGLPVDLTLGMLLQGVSFFDIAPAHTMAVGNGLTCSYLNALGTGVGAKMRAESLAAQAAVEAAP